MRRVILILCLFFIQGAVNAEMDPIYDLDRPEMQININQLQKEQQEKFNKISSSKVKSGKSSEISVESPKTSSSKLKKTSFWKQKKQKQKPKFDTTGGGYYGNLPAIEGQFENKTKKTTKVKDENKNAEEFTPDEFQQSKTDDPLFIDVILNKEGQSSYVSDMIRIMRFLESFRTVVKNHDNIQKFNANVNLLDLYARRIEKLYSDKPEGMSDSYTMLLDLAYHAKVLGNLKFDANYYSQFSPVANTPYDPSNILLEDEKLLSELDKMIFTIRQLNN